MQRANWDWTDHLGWQKRDRSLYFFFKSQFLALQHLNSRNSLRSGKQLFLYQEIAEWSSLDKSIRDMRSLLIFKQALKTAICLTRFYPAILLNILIL